jgi:hypothetical protein
MKGGPGEDVEEMKGREDLAVIEGAAVRSNLQSQER